MKKEDLKRWVHKIKTCTTDREIENEILKIYEDGLIDGQKGLI